MTILLTGCPFCGSNFMIMNTETTKGECAVCQRDYVFSEEDISDAEDRRDRLAEQYLPRLERAFKNKDAEKMAELAEEVAGEGISSWYAWFCVGWSDLQSGKVGTAFDDFKLATQFIDEENFDEFYELAMDATLDSIEKAAREGEDWATEDTTLVDFTGVLFDRFDYLCEQDFMCDLMLRLGMLSDSMDTAGMGGSLIKEIMMIVMDYMSGNTYVPDHQVLLNNAKASVEMIDAKMKELAQDGSMAPNIVKIWGSGFLEFLQMIIESEDALVVDYSDEELLSLCDYWGFHDYDEAFVLLEDAFEYHTGYVMSGKRNKGILKKRDTALKGYLEAFSRPLVEGIPELPEDDSPDHDRICPECGKKLIADDEGLIECQCGFKSRIVTDDIEDLPENVPELVIMARKAFADRDSKMLNNLGERILEFDHENWYGFYALGESCLLDGQICEGIAMFIESCQRLRPADHKEFIDGFVEEVTRAAVDEGGAGQDLVTIFMLSFYETMDNCISKDCGLPMAMIRRMGKAEYHDTMNVSAESMIILPTFSHEVHANASLRYQRDLCSEIRDLTDHVIEDMETVTKDEHKLKADLQIFQKTMRDLLTYAIDKFDKCIAGMSDEQIGFVAGKWMADEVGYMELTVSFMEAFYFEPGPVYNPRSRDVLKSKHAIDRYIEGYLEGSKSS